MSKIVNSEKINVTFFSYMGMQISICFEGNQHFYKKGVKWESRFPLTFDFLVQFATKYENDIESSKILENLKILPNTQCLLRVLWWIKRKGAYKDVIFFFFKYENYFSEVLLLTCVEKEHTLDKQ